MTHFQKNDGWRSGLVQVTKCDYCEQAALPKPLIRVNTLPYHKIQAMNATMENIEWVGYLVGKRKPKERLFIVTNVLVPQQRVTGSSADPTRDIDNPNIIGTVHWHHTMGSFFSTTDRDFAAANHDVTIIMAKANNTAKVRTKLPCGATILEDADLSVWQPVHTKVLQDFLLENRPKITTGTVTPVAYTSKLPNTPSYTPPKKKNDPEWYKDMKYDVEKGVWVKRPDAKGTKLGGQDDVEKILEKQFGVKPAG